MNKYTKPTLLKIEQIFKELDYSVRYEKGNFNSGYCIVDHSKVVVVNKFFDTEGRVNVLVDILSFVMTDEQVLTDKSRQFYRQFLKNNEILQKTN
jgi:hypothetical protein